MPLSLVDHQWLFLLDVAQLIQELPRLNLRATGGELHRTPEQQLIHYNAGRSRVKTTGNHGRRLAIDLNIFVGSRLATLDEIRPAGRFWESLSSSNRWGGNFTTLRDGPHFERNV